jgi:prephenate dehydrogenase
MGLCLANLLSGHCDLMVCSRVLERAKDVSRKVGSKAAGIEGCTDRDIVILAVPTNALSLTAGMVSGIMPKGSLIADISSVKKGIIEDVDMIIPPILWYVSIHPLFSSPGAKLKNTVVIPIRPGPWMPAFTNLLSSSGMRIHEASAEEHDKAMAATQVIHHFALLSLKSALMDMGYPDARDCGPYITNSLRQTMNNMGFLEKNLETIEMIQRANNFSHMARKKFIEAAKKLDEKYTC